MTPSAIRAFRKKLKLSPRDFGVELGCAEKSARITVWRWETGKRKPGPQTILLMRQIGTSTIPVVRGSLSLPLAHLRNSEHLPHPSHPHRMWQDALPKSDVSLHLIPARPRSYPLFCPTSAISLKTTADLSPQRAGLLLCGDRSIRSRTNDNERSNRATCGITFFFQ